jgi:DNA/RNA-binding domain of Phe-tRNA-synthetase-like protein
VIGEPEVGWVDRTVAEEFPELRLWTAHVPAVRGRSPDGLRERLAALSDRLRGGEAVELRRRPIPHAYRVFFRHIGIDPDERPPPAEAAMLARLFHGGHRSLGLPEDALTLAVVETGVPVWALDADRVEGPLGIRPATSGERLGRGELAHAAPEGRLVVADAASPLVELFGDVPDAHAPTRDTRTLLLFSLQVAGVPQVHVDEALWTCAEALDTPS